MKLKQQHKKKVYFVKRKLENIVKKAKLVDQLEITLRKFNL